MPNPPLRVGDIKITVYLMMCEMQTAIDKHNKINLCSHIYIYICGVNFLMLHTSWTVSKFSNKINIINNKSNVKQISKYSLYMQHFVHFLSIWKNILFYHHISVLVTKGIRTILLYTGIYKISMLFLWKADNLLEPKVISLCHQYRGRPAGTFMQSDQAV